MWFSFETTYFVQSSSSWEPSWGHIIVECPNKQPWSRHKEVRKNYVIFSISLNVITLFKCIAFVYCVGNLLWQLRTLFLHQELFWRLQRRSRRRKEKEIKISVKLGGSCFWTEFCAMSLWCFHEASEMRTHYLLLDNAFVCDFFDADSLYAWTLICNYYFSNVEFMGEFYSADHEIGQIAAMWNQNYF